MLRNALGFAQLRAGMVAEAAESLRGALDLSPGAAVIRNNLLLALKAAGQNAEADALLSTVRDGRERDTLRRQIATEAARLPAPKDR